MPINSTIDYIPVMDEFLAHWQATDTALLIAEEDTALGLMDFAALRAELDTIKSTLQVLLNDLEVSRVTLEQTRLSAGDRVAEFNRRIRADFPANSAFNRLPEVPNRNAMPFSMR